jgi:hypothetical protein
MRRIIATLIVVSSLAAATARADSGKIHVCRAAGSTSTAKSVVIPAGSSFTDSANHTLKTTADAKLGAKCASIEATSANDPETQPVKQGKAPLTAQFTLPGVTLEGTVSRTFKPSAAAAPPAKAATAKTAAPAPAATPAPTAAPAKTSSKATPAAASSSSAPTISDAAAPAGSTAKCKDGTYSKSQHHSGTCSHHGGVAAWLAQ